MMSGGTSVADDEVDVAAAAVELNYSTEDWLVVNSDGAAVVE